MKIKNHRLYQDNRSIVPFQKTTNQGTKLKGSKPEFIIIHYTAGPTAKNTIDWFKNKHASASAHLVVGHDGSITQMVRFDTVGWHAGRSSWKDINGLNRFSVGIEIANWGALMGQSGHWRSWTGAPVTDDRVIVAAHRNQPNRKRAWEIFDTEQIETTLEIIRTLASHYDIEPDNVLGHDDISPARKTDPGPAWDMERFRAKVFGRRDDDGILDLFEVTASHGLNLRVGPGVRHDKVQTLTKGIRVSVIDTAGLWWFVASIKDGEENNTGWVHSRWLSRV